MEGIVNLLNRFPIAKFKSKTKENEIKNDKNMDLIEHIRETHTRLNAMKSAFDCETNNDLIEAYIYEIDSLERQYSYLIKKAKAEHVTAF